MKSNLKDFKYIGNELDIFAHAVNWKAYWINLIKPFIGSKVIEVGAGIGTNTKVLNDKKYKYWIALEPDRELFNKLSKNPQDNTKYYNTTAIEYKKIEKSKKFDTILYIDVIEHIQNDKKELFSILDLLEKNGVIIVLVPAHNFLYTAFDKKIGHYRRYNKKMLKSIVPKQCKIQKLIYLDSIGFFASLCNKLILKSSQPTMKQILFWDRILVYLSKIFDKILFFSFGKSILLIMKKTN